MPLNEESGASDRAEDCAVSSADAAPADPQFDQEQARAFLDYLFPGERVFGFQTIYPKKGPRANDKSLLKFVTGMLGASAEALRGKIEQSAGVYFALNKLGPNPPNRQEPSFVDTMGVVSLDLDDSTRDALMASDFLVPHACVETSPGRFHFHWRVNGLELRSDTACTAGEIIERLARCFGGDTSINDIPRVMRLPGSLNRNHGDGEPTRVSWRPMWPEGPYELEAFLAALEKAEQAAGLPPWVKTAGKRPAASGAAPAPVSEYVEPEILVDAIGLLRNDGWCDDPKKWEGVAFAFARLSGGDEEVEAAFEAWSHPSDNNRTPNIFGDAAQGKLHLPPGPCAGNIRNWLLEHSVPGEEKRAVELAHMIAQTVDREVVREGFDDGEGGHVAEGRGMVLSAQEGVAAPRPARVPAFIAELNERYSVIGKIGICEMKKGADGEDGLFEPVSEAAFKLLHRNKRVPVQKGRSTVEVSIGELWLDHPARREYDEVGLWPERLAPPNALNLWQGFAVQPMPGTWGVTEEFLRQVICSGDTALFDYLMNTLAWWHQHPLLKGETNIAMIGGQGSGKGTLGQMLMRNFGIKHAMHVSQGSTLFNRFNIEQLGKLFVFCDEAFFAGDPRINPSFKTLSTEPRRRYEIKGGKVFEGPNRLKMLFASNELRAVPIEVDDRRTTVINVERPFASVEENAAYFENLRAAFWGGEDGPFLRELLNRDLTGFNHRAPFKTAIRAQAALDLAKTSQKFIIDMVRTGKVPGSFSISTAGWDKKPISIGVGALYEAYLARMQDKRVPHPVGRNEFGRDMHTMLPGLTKTRPRSGGGMRPEYYSIPRRAECADHLAKMFPSFEID